MDRHMWIVTGVCILSLFLLITVPLVIARQIEITECNRIARQSNIKTEYAFIGGCYVEVNGRMIPKDNWRGEYEGSYDGRD